MFLLNIFLWDVVLLGGTGASLVAIWNGFGVSNSNGVKFCLIKTSEKLLIIYFGTIPGCVLWCLMAIVYGLVCFALCLRSKPSSLSGIRVAYQVAIKKSLMYPFLFLVVWLPAYIWSIWWYLGSESRFSVWFMILSVNLNGTVNSISYVLVNHLMTKQKIEYTELN